MTIEEWRPIAGVDAYEVSDCGRIRSHRRSTSQVLSPTANSHGYRLFKVDGRLHYVHREVALAFHGEPAGRLVRHLDGNPLNNAAGNLVWGTYSENTLDRVAHGRDRNARKSRCIRGHPFDRANTDVITDARGRLSRRCRRCTRERRQQAKAAA